MCEMWKVKECLNDEENISGNLQLGLISGLNKHFQPPYLNIEKIKNAPQNIDNNSFE